MIQWLRTHALKKRLLIPAALVLLAFAIGHAIAKPEGSVAHRQKITIHARPITHFLPSEPSRTQFGQLEFRSGLILHSDHEAFGGLSSIALDSTGRNMLAVTDAGSWIRTTLTYEGNRLKGLENAEIAPILGPQGKPFAQVGQRDVESLTINGSKAYVGIERSNRIYMFDTSPDILANIGKRAATPAAVLSLPYNQGLEGLVSVSQGPLSGTLLAFSEKGLDSAGNIRCFLIGGPKNGTFSVVRKNDYDITDAAPLPNGDIVILERRFSLFSGPSMRLRRLSQAEIRDKSVADGPILLEAGFSHEIDNMEGLAISTNAAGETIFTLVSDDNFSWLQRTLILQFAYREAEGTK